MIIFPSPCFAFRSDRCGSLRRHLCTWKKSSQHSQDDDWISHVGYQESTCRSWHLSLLPGSHVVSYCDWTFSSWVVYGGYTRSRGCLWSARPTQMWPGTVIVAVREQRVKKKKKKKKEKKRGKIKKKTVLTYLKSVVLLFYILFPDPELDYF